MTTEALKIRPSQTRLALIKKALDEKNAIWAYDEEGKPYIYDMCDMTGGLDEYLLNEMITLCKGRDLSDTRLRNNQIWKRWIWDMVSMEDLNELYDNVVNVYYPSEREEQ